MKREKLKRTRLLLGLIGVLCLMTVGYAASMTSFTVRGTATLKSSWDLEITNVTVGEKTTSAENATTPTWEGLTASMEANLYDAGDYVIYNVTVRNNGSLDAKLNSIDFDTSKGTNAAIKISVVQPALNDVLTHEQSKVIKVKIEYDSTYTGTIDYSQASDVTITLNYIQN